MKGLIELASKPLGFSFLLAIAVGTSLYQTSQRAVPVANAAAQYELTILAHQVAHSFLVSELEGRSPQSRSALESALAAAVRHKRVVAASVLNERGETLAHSQETIGPRI